MTAIPARTEVQFTGEAKAVPAPDPRGQRPETLLPTRAFAAAGLARREKKFLIEYGVPFSPLND